ncbi:hypothetical protein ACFL26_01950 [Patescibacteria group bacterium]
MGGGGSYYDRDVSVTRRTTSSFSEQVMSRRSLDPAVDPKNRKLVTEARSPIVFPFDDTGSMGTLPKVIVDKMPMICGQVAEMQILDDPVISVATFGDDGNREPASIQVGDFTQLRNADSWFQRLWLVGNGGGNGIESYELAMYYYAYMCDIPNAETPIFILTGDEGFYAKLPRNRLDRLFGRKFKRNKATTARQVFADLDRKFKGNVFIVRKRYSDESRVMRQWTNLMGRSRIALLGEDKAIGDVALGVIALASGRYDLDQYLASMAERKQTKTRIANVRESLVPVAEYCAGRG